MADMIYVVFRADVLVPLIFHYIRNFSTEMRKTRQQRSRPKQDHYKNNVHWSVGVAATIPTECAKIS